MVLPALWSLAYGFLRLGVADSRSDIARSSAPKKIQEQGVSPLNSTDPKEGAPIQGAAVHPFPKSKALFANKLQMSLFLSWFLRAMPRTLGVIQTQTL